MPQFISSCSKYLKQQSLKTILQFRHFPNSGLTLLKLVKSHSMQHLGEEDEIGSTDSKGMNLKVQLSEQQKAAVDKNT